MERQKVVTHVQTVDTRLRYECLLILIALFNAQQKVNKSQNGVVFLIEE